MTIPTKSGIAAAGRRTDIRILVVDDNAVFRLLLKRGLNAIKGITVVGTAVDPYDAREKIIQLKPDVLTLDIVMPRMNGLVFLRKLMESYPMPVIVVSAWSPKDSPLMIKALSDGAFGVIHKPDRDNSPKAIFQEIAELARNAPTPETLNRMSNLSQGKPVRPVSGNNLSCCRKLVAIGASTGGVQTLQHIFTRLPANSPGIVVVQHMPASFTRSFADRLNSLCSMEVKEAEHLDMVKQGRILIAPGGKHMTVAKKGTCYQVLLNDGPKVHHQRPSADVLFHSVAECAGTNAVGIILTGMGKDGAEGLLAMQQAGARTVAQDEKSCVVYGMPMEAVRRGAVDETVLLDEMSSKLLELAYQDSAKPLEVR